ncbi:MAG TPA: response regulator transcription factor [Planktothrix sp.]|jgi:DNA-binding response OmpR family regulator
MAKILVVEDDGQLSAVVRDWLSHKEKHAVDVVETGAEALSRLQTVTYDAVILDLRLPDMSGLDVCRQFRAAGGQLPIIMLTGKSKLHEKTEGLDSGADDYLTKPFHPEELAARLRALLRRQSPVATKQYRIGSLMLEPNSLTVSKDGNRLSLPPKEFALLEFFMRHPDQVFSPEALMERVWPSDSDASPDTVRVHIKHLRSKIDTEGQPSMIRTLHRQGYKLESTPRSGD